MQYEKSSGKFDEKKAEKYSIPRHKLSYFMVIGKQSIKMNKRKANEIERMAPVWCRYWKVSTSWNQIKLNRGKWTNWINFHIVDTLTGTPHTNRLSKANTDSDSVESHWKCVTIEKRPETYSNIDAFSDKFSNNCHVTITDLFLLHFRMCSCLYGLGSCHSFMC